MGFDILVVDDGSTSNVFEVCSKKGVYYLRLPRNMGKGRALREGFKWGMNKGYEIFATVDGDGQHKARHFFKFLEKIKTCDMVVGSRRRCIRKMDFPRIMSNRITSTFISLMTGRRLEDTQSGYRLIKRRVIQALNLKRNRYDMESEILVKALWKGFKVDFVPIDVIPSSKSFINPVKDVLLAITLAIELVLQKS